MGCQTSASRGYTEHCVCVCYSVGLQVASSRFGIVLACKRPSRKQEASPIASSTRDPSNPKPLDHTSLSLDSFNSFQSPKGVFLQPRSCKRADKTEEKREEEMVAAGADSIFRCRFQRGLGLRARFQGFRASILQDGLGLRV